jgi:hypothetical protein
MTPTPFASPPAPSIPLRAARYAVLSAVAALALAGCTVKDSHPVAVTPQIVPTELWVAPDGLDNNPGTRAAPLRSLARAAQLVTPGTTVNVLPGAYQGGFRTSVSGLPNARIVFRSTERWQARIVPPPVSTSSVAWDNHASYVDILGFEVDGTGHASGQPWTTGIHSGGTYNRIATSHVHHVGLSAPCSGKAGAGIGVDSANKGMFAEVTANSVHDIGPTGCRLADGIAMGTPGTVRNNIVYRAADAGIRLGAGARRVVVLNNTIAASRTGVLVAGDDQVHVLNNIIYDNRRGIAEQGPGGKRNSYRNNLVYGSAEDDWRLAGGVGHAGSIAAAPGFLAYTRTGTPDFRLAAHSAAIGKGLEHGSDGPDFYGKPRAQADDIDLGACQH